MTKEEKIFRICEYVLLEQELTTKELTNWGLTSKDLSSLIAENIIVRQKRGCYAFVSSDSLFAYGQRLSSLGYNEKATLCFKKCLELNPNHLGACQQLFLESIELKDYDMAFELLKVLEKSPSQLDSKDNKFYLYLLNQITDIPENYRETIKTLEYQDISIPLNNEEYGYISRQNLVRFYALRGRFQNAFSYYNDLMKFYGTATIRDIIIVELLKQAAEKNNELNKSINDLIKGEEYDEIIKLLAELDKKLKLTNYQKNILFLTKTLLHIKAGNMPVALPPKGELNFQTALVTNNFDAALRINIEYNAQRKIRNEGSSYYLLLKEICDLLKKEDIEFLNIEQFENDSNDDVALRISKIIAALKAKDESAILLIRQYLNEIGRSNCEFLIRSLVKLDQLDNDETYSKLKSMLILLSNQEYLVDASSFVEEFYMSLATNNFEKAKLYLSIISSLRNSKVKDALTVEKMTEILDNTAKTLELKKSGVPKEKIKEQIGTLNSAESEAQEMTEETRVLTELLERKCDELIKQKGIVLLELDLDKYEFVEEFVKKYKNIAAFKIDGDLGGIVLRYKEKYHAYVNFSDLIRLSSEAFNQHDYDKCIEINLNLLAYFREPRAVIYSKLGMSYLKNNQIDQAITYLTVATLISKNTKDRYDYTALIGKLRYDMERCSKVFQAKPYCYMHEQEFNPDSNYYGIDFEQINDFVINSKMDIISALRSLNISSEKIMLILLIYVKEYYSQGDFGSGDLLLRIVEKSRDKTAIVNKALSDILRNKKIYQNRGKQKNLSLPTYLVGK